MKPAPTDDRRLSEDSRLAVDAAGYVWWVHADGTHTMARTNPDNEATPMPFTFYEPVPDGMVVRRRASRLTEEDWNAS